MANAALVGEKKGHVIRKRSAITCYLQKVMKRPSYIANLTKNGTDEYFNTYERQRQMLWHLLIQQTSYRRNFGI